MIVFSCLNPKARLVPEEQGLPALMSGKRLVIADWQVARCIVGKQQNCNGRVRGNADAYQAQIVGLGGQPVPVSWLSDGHASCRPIDHTGR